MQWASRTATPEDFADAVGLLVQNKEWTEAMMGAEEVFDSGAKGSLNDFQGRLLDFAMYHVDED